MRAIDRVRAVLDVRPGEGAASLWAAIGFFAIMTAYFVLRPIRDALGLRDFAFVPWLFTATFLVMTALAAPWGALVARMPRRRLVPISFRAFMAQLLIFAGLMAAAVAPGIVAKAFYVWSGVFNLFVVSVFWSVCTDLTRPDQGRRLVGPIAAGGSAGTVLGSYVMTGRAAHLEPWVLLLISAALLELAVWAMMMVDRHGRRLTASATATTAAAASDVAERQAARAVGGGPLTGLANLVRSRYLAGIAAYALCAATLATLVYLTQGKIANAALPDRTERTQFFASVELWTGLGTIVLQSVVTSRLLRWLGPGLVLAALPVVQGFGLAALVAVPTLAMATVVSAAGRAATHGLSRPARELLYTAVAREDRFKTKNVIDTLVYRFGDFSSAWAQRGLIYVEVPISAVGVSLAGLWMLLAVWIGFEHRRRVAAPTTVRDGPTEETSLTRR